MSANGGLQLDQIQGVILRGFPSHPYIRHFLFHIADTDGARALCAQLVPGSGAPMTVTLAAAWPPGEKPPYCLNFAVSKGGLETLITAANYATVRNASGQLIGPTSPFERGADNPATARIVGDTGASSPDNWWKNGHWQLSGETPSNDLLDILITLYTPTPDAREQFTKELLAMIPCTADGRPSIVAAFIEDGDPLDPPGSIHFGYADGISQPRVAGVEDMKAASRNDAIPDDRPEVPAYFFVIDGKNADAPYNNHPFLANGCFGAFRLLHQDVGAFETFIAQAGQEAELVAAKMAGRWRDGTPLEVSPDKPDPSIQGHARTNFNYASATPNQQNPPAAPGFDTSGARCPYASHIRRTSPRDDGAVSGNSPVTQMHRVMRRAFPYGPAYSEDPGADRGLAGLFMGVSLNEQFEFLQQTWIGGGFFRNPDLSPNSSGVDPLFGPQAGQNSSFDYLAASGQYTTVADLQRFIRTDGSLYVFLPAMQAMLDMSKGAISSS